MLPDRIDALEGTTSHLGDLAGAVFDDAEDAELQALVREASAALTAPIALVSLVLRHVQLFRAHVGLPPHLAVSRATDRCVSFCQYVVRDRAPFEVNDALGDPRVPQLLPRTQGVRAYLGVPLRVAGRVVGSFCVLDVVPRTFTQAELELLVALAERASVRLTDLAATSADASAQLLAHASGASFGEMRNVLTGLMGNVVLARVAAAELAARLRVEAEAGHGASAAGDLLLEVPSTVGEIQLSLGDVETTAARLKSLVTALEGLALPTAQPTTLSALLEAADELARHTTKLVGGVRITMPEGRVGLAGRGGATLAVLSALLSMVASRMVPRAMWRGMDLDAAERAGAIVLAVRAPLPDEDFAAVAARLRPLVPGPDLDVRARAGAVELTLDLSYADAAAALL